MSAGIRLLLFFFLISLPWTGFGQKVTYTVENYGLDDGLPSNRIFALVKHSSGFIYTGTVQGLHRFDGREFIPMKEINGNELVTKSTIFRGCETKEGKLLLMCSMTGITSIAGQGILYDPVTESVDSLTIEGFNKKWDESKKYFDQDIKVLDQWKEDSIDITVFGDSFGNTLTRKITGLNKEHVTLTLSDGEKINLSDAASTLLHSGTPIGHNLGDVIYYGGHNGLLKIAINRSPFKTFLHEDAAVWEYAKRCRAIISAGKDSVIVSIEGKGIHLIDLKKDNASKIKFNPEGSESPLDRHFFRSFWVDPAGELVIAPHLRTIFKLNISKETYSPLVESQNVFLGGAVFKENKYILARQISNTGPYFLEILDKNTGSLDTVEFQNGNDIVGNQRPTYVEVVADTSVWYATKSGLFHLDIKNQKVKHLFLGKEEAQKAHPFPVSYSLSESHVWTMHHADDGKLWIGMQATGVNILDTKSLGMEYLNKENGLSNNTVVGFLPDTFGYWISTFHGLSYLDTATMEFRNFYHSNGISHNEFNRFSFHIDKSGRYFFGTMNGVTSFYPEEVLKRDEKHNLLVSEIRNYNTKGEEVLKTNYAFSPTRIVIPSNNRYLSVTMTLSDNSNPSANTFFYKLVSSGGDPDIRWKSLSVSNEVEFESLEAGAYDLILRGVSSDGVSSNEVVIPVLVHELFYRTWWFIGLSLLSASILVFIFFRMRLKQALRMERLRTRLSSDLHDDVGGILSGVAFQMEALEHQVDPALRPQISQIAKSSRKAMERMRDTVWAIDARRQTIGDLRDRMLESSNELLEPLEIAYIIDISAFTPSTILTAEVRHNLLLIFKEFISNTIKHATATSVDVRFIKQGKELKMEIFDNGIGLPQDSGKRTGQGLKNMEMRAEKIGGEITFINEKGFGVIVIVPW